MLKSLIAPAYLRTDRRVLRRLEVGALIVLIPLAIYLWIAPILADHALAKASLHALLLASRQHPGNPRVFYYLGLRYRQIGDLEQAERSFSRAAQLDGDDAASWIAWAAATEANERDEDAYQILNSFLRSHPRSAPAHYALALLYQQHQAHKRALEEARAAVKWYPQHADAWRLTGEEAIYWARLPEAEAAMRRAVTLRPRDWRNQMDLGNVLMERNQSIAAIPCYREAVRLAPREALAQLCLGRALLSQAQTEAEIDTAQQSLLQAAALQPDLAPAYLLLGQSYARQRRWLEARRALEQGERLAPNSVDIAFALSGVYRHTGDLADAAREARRHQLLKDYNQQKYALISRIEAAPNDIATRLEVARLCAAHGDDTDARYFYRSALARAPDSEAARQELAALEDKRSRADRPVVTLTGVSDPAAISETVLLQNADALRGRSDFEGAKKTYLAVLAHDRSSALAYQGLGLILNEQGKAEDAFLFLEHAIRLNSRLPEAQYVLAQRYREIGFDEEAARRMNLVVQQSPNTPGYWHELGTDYGDTESEKAEQAFRRAAELDPHNVPYLLDLADRQADNGRSAEAETTYRRAVALASDNSDALSRLGGFLLNTPPTDARLQEAEHLLRRAVELDPNNNFAWYGLGRLAMKRSHTQEAVTCFERVVAETPDIADAWYALSRAYLLMGNHARAQAAADHSRQLHQDYLDRIHTAELIRLHPNDPELHLKLARLSAKNGETAKAILQYRICLQQAPHNSAVRRELDSYMAFLKAKGRTPAMNIFNLMVADMARRD